MASLQRSSPRSERPTRVPARGGRGTLGWRRGAGAAVPAGMAAEVRAAARWDGVGRRGGGSLPPAERTPRDGAVAIAMSGPGRHSWPALGERGEGGFRVASPHRALPARLGRRLTHPGSLAPARGMAAEPHHPQLPDALDVATAAGPAGLGGGRGPAAPRGPSGAPGSCSSNKRAQAGSGWPPLPVWQGAHLMDNCV